VGAKDPADTVELKGHPNISLVIPGGSHGDIANRFGGGQFHPFNSRSSRGPSHFAGSGNRVFPAEGIQVERTTSSKSASRRSSPDPLSASPLTSCRLRGPRARRWQRHAELIRQIQQQPRSLCIKRSGKLGLYSPFAIRGAFKSSRPERACGLHHFNQLFFAGALPLFTTARASAMAPTCSARIPFIASLIVCPRAVWPQVKPFLAHHSKHRLDRAQRFRVAANHEHQVPFARAPVSSGYRSIQESYVALAACRGNPPGHHRGNRAGIDVHAAGTQTAQRSIVFPSCPQRISSSAGGSLTIVNRMFPRRPRLLVAFSPASLPRLPVPKRVTPCDSTPLRNGLP